MNNLDADRQKIFSERIRTVLNNASLALLISIGHQTGLFDTMAQLTPATAREIAGQAGLNERYVLEWLNAMVVAEIVEYEPGARLYRLPPEHAVSLTRRAALKNQAAVAQYIAMYGEVEQQVVRAFRDGGGVPYSAYPRYHKVRDELSRKLYDAALISSIVPLVPGLAERLRSGIDVLDIGTGQGHAINLLARHFPQSRFRGIDISEHGIIAALAEADRWGLENANFAVAESTEVSNKYDLITTFDVIHDLAQPDATLRAIHAGLNSDGVFLMADVGAASDVEKNIGQPAGVSLYGSSIFRCMTTSLAQGGEGLGTMWGRDTALERLGAAGFVEIDVKRIEADVINEYFIARVR